jgi:hypothetical protein
MKFDFSALKAYVAASLGAGAATTIAAYVVHGAEAALGVSAAVPASVDLWIVGGLAAAFGYVSVYFTPNSAPKA